MKKFQIKYHLENGQVLPLVVLMFFVIIGMIALILDGGSIMSNRRTAQAAADAGALAGAKRICLSKSDAEAVAEDYAKKNNATTATAKLLDKTVTVKATVEHPSFFAKIFGQQTLKATAEATAGCFPIKGKNVMPIAWSCRPPVPGVTVPGLGCKIMTLDWLEEVKPIVIDGVTMPVGDNIGDFSNNSGTFSTSETNIVKDVTKMVKVCKKENGKVIVVEELVTTKEPANEIYIIMDKGSINEEICKESPINPGTITCDLNVPPDGKLDIEGGGNRGWLDLNNGGGGASDLKGWIDGSKTSQVAPHTWLSGQPGEISIAYGYMSARVGQVVRIPIFNSFCDKADPTNNAACMALAGHPSPWPSGIDSVPGNGKSPMFHIVTFDSFYVSCVHSKQGDYCPGFALAQKINTPLPTDTDKNCPTSTIPDNTSSVEGYFLTNVDNPVDFTVNCSVNLGNCKVSLIK